MRIKQDQRGISNVIVVMLSLVILVTIVANVVLWSYQMNQLDWEKMQEDINIVDVRDTWSYNPSGYAPGGSTSLASGSVSNLASDDSIYMTIRSYATTSSQTLHAHNETITIGGASYYLKKLESADGPATSLSASMATTGRQLLGKFVYPLTGVSSTPASTWTMYYRAWRDSDPAIAFDAQSSITQSTEATSVSWNHSTGTGSNRLLLVAVGVHVATGTPTTASSVTYGGVALTQVTAALYSVTDPQVRTYVFRLVNPASGTHTINVTFAAATLSVSGAVTYTGVDQTTPIQTSTTATGSGKSQSASVTVTGDGRWLFGHLGGHTTPAWTITEGAGQTNRWAQEAEKYKGRGSDKAVSAGSQSTNWTTKPVSWVASALVINPATAVGHADVDILIRKSDGTIRTTIATGVAESGTITTVATTLSGTYSWSAYTVVDQTDYLEIDYYVHVTTAASGVNAYLRIDDSALAITDQTRATNIMLPSKYTVEVEFTGSSNMYNWTELVWTVDSAWTTTNVNVTLQLFNHILDDYPTSGNGYLSYTSSATYTEETKNQTITVNPTHFRNATSFWRMKVKGVKATDTQFDFKVDWVEFKVGIKGTLFTFKNTGSLTSHLVSLWVTNSTHHRPYDMDVILNSGETLPYLSVDISLPSGQYMVKVVTERGNIAVFSGG